MTTLRLDKSTENSAANAPAHTDRWAVTRAARRLASSPVSLYLWLSGPPLTELDRNRGQPGLCRERAGPRRVDSLTTAQFPSERRPDGRRFFLSPTSAAFACATP